MANDAALAAFCSEQLANVLSAYDAGLLSLIHVTCQGVSTRCIGASYATWNPVDAAIPMRSFPTLLRRTRRSDKARQSALRAPQPNHRRQKCSMGTRRSPQDTTRQVRAAQCCGHSHHDMTWANEAASHHIVQLRHCSNPNQGNVLRF